MYVRYLFGGGGGGGSGRGCLLRFGLVIESY